MGSIYSRDGIKEEREQQQTEQTRSPALIEFTFYWEETEQASKQ